AAHRSLWQTVNRRHYLVLAEHGGDLPLAVDPAQLDLSARQVSRMLFVHRARIADLRSKEAIADDARLPAVCGSRGSHGLWSEAHGAAPSCRAIRGQDAHGR